MSLYLTTVGLENKTYEEQLREQEIALRQRGGDLIVVYNSPRGGCSEEVLVFFSGGKN